MTHPDPRDPTPDALRIPPPPPPQPVRWRRALREWQKEPDLAVVRETAGLILLPEEDRKAFLQLWTDVAAVLAKAAS